MKKKKRSSQGKNFNQRKNYNQQWWLAPAVLLACVIVFLLWRYLPGKEPGEEKTELPEKGSEAYQFYAEQFRAEVAAYFGSTYGINLGSDEAAWTESYGDEVPAEMIDEKVIEAAKEDEIRRQLAKEYGAEPMMTVEDMLASLDDFNRQRQEQREAGEVVYGLDVFGMQQYYMQMKGYAETDLYDAIVEDALKNKTEILYERYEAMEAEELINDREITLRAYMIEPEEFRNQPEAADAALELILQEVSDNPQITAEELSALCSLPVSSWEQEFIRGTIGLDDTWSMYLLDRGWKEDCFRDRMDNYSENDCVYRVIDRLELVKPLFEDVKQTVAAIYATEFYEEEIARRMEQE